MKSLVSFVVVFLSVATSRGASSVSAWVPIFQGIDQAKGTNDAAYLGTLSANALRVDLQNPDIRINITPPVTNGYMADVKETLLQTPREFATEYGLQVAINSGHFSPAGYNYPSGTPAAIQGLTISKGRLVSAQTSSNDSLSAILFTTNNRAIFVPINWPPTNTAGIYNAVSGFYPLVADGVNVAYRYTNAFSDFLHMAQPRTAYGLSEDNRYLILMTIDGRQDFSDGALDYETADLLLLFGARNGIQMDGGGSTCVVKANECGVPVDINHNSFQEAVGRPGSQRPVGYNLGISALPIAGPMRNVTVLPGTTTATITWQTEEEATTQVEYGPTVAYGSATPFDDSPRKFHVATLSGLTAGASYYYRAASLGATQEYSTACTFSTTNSALYELLVPITGKWKYSTNNLDAVNWKALEYDDSGWFGPSNGAFHIESSAGSFPPMNTVLPPGFTTPIFRTYYFRTPFQFSGSSAGVSLTFSNYIDDGAAFYLNGAEVKRIRLVAGALNSTFASSPVSCPPVNDAVCPDVFAVSGSQLASLVQGTNVIAAELHNYATGSDIFFASSLLLGRPGTPVPRLFIASEAGQATLYWNGEGFTLQQSSDLSSTNNWSDVQGPVTQSPFTTPNIDSAFYRLRN